MCNFYDILVMVMTGSVNSKPESLWNRILSLSSDFVPFIRNNSAGIYAAIQSPDLCPIVFINNNLRVFLTSIELLTISIEVSIISPALPHVFQLFTKKPHNSSINICISLVDWFYSTFISQKLLFVLFLSIIEFNQSISIILHEIKMNQSNFTLM